MERKDRHPGHYLDSYIFSKRNEYKPSFEYKYDDLISNSINLGKVITVDDIEKVNIEEIISELNIK